MKQSIQLKQTQQLSLSPQLKQAIKLLQCSSLEFTQEVERILLDNPLLELENEVEEDFSVGTEMGAGASDKVLTQEISSSQEEGREAFEPDSVDWQWSEVSGHGGDDEFDPMLNVAQEDTFREYLLTQLSEHRLEARDNGILTLLIEELDEKGYLTTSLVEMVENLPLELMLEPEEFAIGLKLLQQFEPVGVGSSNLQEFLCLQLKSKESNPAQETALSIVQNHYDALSAGQGSKLAKILACPEQVLQDTLSLIASLNSYPASGFSRERTHYVSPDVVVKKQGKKWVVNLNRKSVPKVKLNQMYAQAVACSDDQNEMMGRLQEAQWFLKSIEQRFDTISRVATEIVEVQQDFFDEGDLGMKPLTLKDVADKLGVHESTVSRISTQKYLLCPRGLFELKYFFSQGLVSDSGDLASNMAIKARIKDIVAAENPAKPYSDNVITQILKQEGISVARRTVAKYRETLQIKSASERKFS